MARQWVVLFDTLGVDVLIPWDDLKGDNILDVLSGKKPRQNLSKQISMMLLRAHANIQRWPEVWAYDTSVDWSYEDMRRQWESAPQVTADTVRQHGTNIFRHHRSKEVII